jgi:hypothetical protein
MIEGRLCGIKNTKSREAMKDMLRASFCPAALVVKKMVLEDKFSPH